MRHIATDGVVRSVCLCVCLSVGHVRESWTNDWTGWYADGGADPGGSKESCITWDSDRPKGRGNSWGLSSPFKSIVLSLLRYTQQKHNDIIATAADDCIAPNWRVTR